MASAISALLATLLLHVFIPLSSATNYTVGDALGWTTRVDYSAWTFGKTFILGDNLVFNYPRGIHTVNEVSAADYIACSAINYMSTDSSGATVISLTVGGPHYFICSVPGHCTDGMKVWLTIEPSPLPDKPTNPPPATSPPPPINSPLTPTAAGNNAGTNMPGGTPTSPFNLTSATGSLISASSMVLLSGVVMLLKLSIY